MPFVSLASLEPRRPVAGFVGRFVHSEAVTVAYWDVEAGAALPEHTHPHEQVANVLSGRFELSVDGESRILDEGEVAVIPPGVPHGGRALTACRILDVFHPVRDDYR